MMAKWTISECPVEEEVEERVWTSVSEPFQDSRRNAQFSHLAQILEDRALALEAALFEGADEDATSIAKAVANVFADEYKGIAKALRQIDG